MVEMKGIIQEIDGLVGLTLFSTIFVGLLFAYAEFGNSAGLGIASLQTYISDESAAQHVLYILEGSNASTNYFDETMDSSGYRYALLDLNNSPHLSGTMGRIAVIQGKMYVVEVG